MEKEIQVDLDQYIATTIISKIIHYRKLVGVSQRELSRRSNVTQNIISRMENGIAIPQLGTLSKLLNALELTVELDIKGKGENSTM